MPSATTLADNIGLLPLEIGTATPVYPFTVQGDFTTLVITRTYRQLAVAYQPGQPGITTDARPSNAEDGVIYYPDAYLISPENVRPIGVAGVVEFSRTFARIPLTHYEPASRLFDRPVMHDIKSGTTYFVSFDNGVTSHRFASRVAVTVVGAITQPTTTVAIAAETFGTLPGTTFTIVDDGGASSSPNLNNGASSIQSTLDSALTGLTSVAVSSTPDSLSISWVGTIKSVSTSATGVTMSGGSGVNGTVTFTAARPTTNDVESPAAPTGVRVLTTGAGHSGSAGEWVALWNEDKIVAMVKAVAASGTSITVPVEQYTPLALGSVAITHCAFASTAGARYENGPTDCSARTTVRFYLPGVTSGVTTMSDVPNFAPKTSPIAWAGEVVSYAASPSAATYSVIETAALERWLDGPILVKRVVELQLADALTTCAVGG